MDEFKYSWIDKIKSGTSKFSKLYFFFYNVWDNPYKNVRKCIPRYTWKDKDHVIQDVLFQIFLDFVNIEDPHWRLVENKQKVIDFEIVYDYLTEERPSIKKKIEELDISDECMYYIGLLEQCDEEAEEIIFKWRNTLWT